MAVLLLVGVMACDSGKSSGSVEGEGVRRDSVGADLYVRSSLPDVDPEQLVREQGENGQGIAKLFPPLIESENLADDKNAITGVLQGHQGDSGVMPAFAHLPDATIAQILTFVRQAFGNDYSPVETAQVAEVREALEGAGP